VLVSSPPESSRSRPAVLGREEPFNQMVICLPPLVSSPAGVGQLWWQCVVSWMAIRNWSVYADEAAAAHTEKHAPDRRRPHVFRVYLRVGRDSYKNRQFVC